jgi:hypothetical protein
MSDSQNEGIATDRGKMSRPAFYCKGLLMESTISAVG